MDLSSCSATSTGRPSWEHSKSVGPLGFLGDALHVPVGTNITTLNVFFQGGNAALTANMGTGLVLDRLLDQPTQFADLGGGFFALGDATANDRFASIRCTGCHTAAAAGERMSNCYSTVIGIIQVHRVSSAQVLGLSRYEARALQAACSVSAVTGYRRFEIIA